MSLKETLKKITADRLFQPATSYPAVEKLTQEIISTNYKAPSPPVIRQNNHLVVICAQRVGPLFENPILTDPPEKP